MHLGPPGIIATLPGQADIIRPTRPPQRRAQPGEEEKGNRGEPKRTVARVETTPGNSSRKQGRQDTSGKQNPIRKKKTGFRSQTHKATDAHPSPQTMVITLQAVRIQAGVWLRTSFGPCVSPHDGTTEPSVNEEAVRRSVNTTSLSVYFPGKAWRYPYAKTEI